MPELTSDTYTNLSVIGTVAALTVFVLVLAEGLSHFAIQFFIKDKKDV